MLEIDCKCTNSLQLAPVPSCRAQLQLPPSELFLPQDLITIMDVIAKPPVRAPLGLQLTTVTSRLWRNVPQHALHICTQDSNTAENVTVQTLSLRAPFQSPTRTVPCHVPPILLSTVVPVTDYRSILETVPFHLGPLRVLLQHHLQQVQ